MIHQYNLRKGLELSGDKAEAAKVKELSQIHKMGTYVPLDAGELTAEQKAKALTSLMFIVEKRDGRIKVRNVPWVASNQLLKGTTGPIGHPLR